MWTTRRRWQHAAGFDHPTRRLLEHAGWRTMLDYRENHVRSDDGTLLDIVTRWTAEAEWCDSRRVIASATADSVDEAWTRLQRAIDASELTTELVA